MQMRLKFLGTDKNKLNEEKGSLEPLMAVLSKKKCLPTLDYGCAVSRRATKLGFCWPTLKEVFGDLKSEVLELENELETGSMERLTDELGDIIYALCNVVSTRHPGNK